MPFRRASEISALLKRYFNTQSNVGYLAADQVCDVCIFLLFF